MRRRKPQAGRQQRRRRGEIDVPAPPEQLVPYFPNGILIGTGEDPDINGTGIIEPEEDTESDVADGSKSYIFGSTPLPPDDGGVPADVSGVAIDPGVQALFLSWTANAEIDMENGYGEYQVQVDGTDNTFANVIRDVRVGRNALAVTGLTTGVTYYVRVRAYDANGEVSAGWSTTASDAPIEVDSGDIAANAITAVKILAGAVTAGKIDADAVTATELAAVALEVGKYIQSTTYVAGTSGWRINADGTAEFDTVTARGQFATGSSGQYAVLDNDSVEFFPSDLGGSDLPGSIQADTDNLLSIKPSDLSGDQSEVILAGQASSAYSGSAFHVLAKRHRLSLDPGGTPGVFTFPTTRGGAMKDTWTQGTSAAWSTAPVTVAGKVDPTAVGVTWDGTNDYWQAPASWFEDAVTGITVLVFAYCEIEANGTGFRGIRVQKYAIGSGTSVETYTLGTAVGSAAAEYRDGGSVGLELTSTNQGIRLQMFQNSGGNRASAYHWGITYTGFY